MHLLLDHTMAWVERWHVGFGPLGEQGANSNMPNAISLYGTYADK